MTGVVASRTNGTSFKAGQIVRKKWPSVHTAQRSQRQRRHWTLHADTAPAAGEMLDTASSVILADSLTIVVGSYKCRYCAPCPLRRCGVCRIVNAATIPTGIIGSVVIK